MTQSDSMVKEATLLGTALELKIILRIAAWNLESALKNRMHFDKGK